MNGMEARTIRSALEECDSHLSRIKRAKKLLEPGFPLSGESLASLDEDRIGLLDQLIYRFIKLQDSMGTRLLPSLHAYVQKDDSPKPFLIVLNDLEKLEIITSVEDWQFFRNLRNNLAHDYPESIAQTAQSLNLLVQELHRMEEMYLKVRTYWHTVSSL